MTTCSERDNSTDHIDWDAMAEERLDQRPRRAGGDATHGAKSALADCFEHGELRGRDLTQIFNPTERRLVAETLRSVAQSSLERGEPVAYTNAAQLGFLKDPKFAEIPMAMWAESHDTRCIPLYASPERGNLATGERENEETDPAYFDASPPAPLQAIDGEAAIREAAESASVGAHIVKSDGDLLVYYSGFNLSRFVRYLALSSTDRDGK